MASIIDILPTELITEIIDVLAATTAVPTSRLLYWSAKHRGRYFPDLKACSLTCHAFLPHCRKHIFSSIKLESAISTSPRALESNTLFAGIISQTPTIADCVRELRFHFTTNQNLDESSLSLLSSILKSLNQLTSIWFFGFIIESRYTFNWKDMELSLRYQICRLIRLPSVTSIQLQDITAFQLLDLTLCPGLKGLGIGGTTFSDESCDPSLTSLADPLPTPSQVHFQLERLAIRYNKPPTQQRVLSLHNAHKSDVGLTLDFKTLKSFKMYIINKKDVLLATEFSQRMRHLVHLEIQCMFTVTIGRSKATNSAAKLFNVYAATFVAFDWNSFVSGTTLDNLRSLVLDIISPARNPGPNNWIGAYVLLQHMSHLKHIRHIEMRAFVTSQSSVPATNYWGQLETILLDVPDGWPSLIHVDLELTVPPYSSDPSLKQSLLNLS